MLYFPIKFIEFFIQFVMSKIILLPFRVYVIYKNILCNICICVLI